LHENTIFLSLSLSFSVCIITSSPSSSSSSFFFFCARRNLQVIRSNAMHNQEKAKKRRLKSLSLSSFSCLSDEPNLLEASNAFNDVVRHTSQTR
jgi:hypothetical protein